MADNADSLRMTGRERDLRLALEDACRVLRYLSTRAPDTRIGSIADLSQWLNETYAALDRHAVAWKTDRALPSSSCEPSAPGPVTTVPPPLSNSRG